MGLESLFAFATTGGKDFPVAELLVTPYHIVGVLAVVVFILYFAFQVSPVDLHWDRRNPVSHHIVKNCKSLNSYFFPSIWLFNSHLQGIFMTKLRAPKSIEYERHYIKSDDGALLAVDWAHPPCAQAAAPVVLFLTGATGHSRSHYVTHMVARLLARGFRTAILIYPGLQNTPVVVPRFMCMSKIDDVRCFVTHAEEQYPTAFKLSVGFSLGAHLWTCYYGQAEPPPNLIGCVAFSSPWQPGLVNVALARPLQRTLYEPHFVNIMQNLVRRHIDVFSTLQTVDTEEVLKVRTILDFDDKLSCRLFGYANAQEYYTASDSTRAIPNIAVPFLCAHALDDPLVPAHAVPTHALRANPHIIFAVTRVGGHNCWIEGVNPFSSPTWMERVALEFFDARLAQVAAAMPL